MQWGDAPISMWMHGCESRHAGSNLTLSKCKSSKIRRRRGRTGGIKTSPPSSGSWTPVEVKLKMNVSLSQRRLQTKGRDGADRAVLVWHVCNVCWYIVCQSPAGQQPQPCLQTPRLSGHLSSLTVICAAMCACVCLCVSVFVWERTGWVFGSGSFQRTWEQPCFLNIHAWCPQWQVFFFFVFFLHQTSKEH